MLAFVSDSAEPVRSRAREKDEDTCDQMFGSDNWPSGRRSGLCAGRESHSVGYDYVSRRVPNHNCASFHQEYCERRHKVCKREARWFLRDTQPAARKLWDNCLGSGFCRHTHDCDARCRWQPGDEPRHATGQPCGGWREASRLNRSRGHERQRGK